MSTHHRHAMRRIEHHFVCQHRIEVAIWPPSAEVYYSAEPTVDPVNTQVRFDAVVLNAPTDRVTWSVHDLSGGPGPGSIDPFGLYTAPPKDDAPFVRSAIIVATAVDDPMRMAKAFVTLVDAIPLIPPKPSIDIFPKHAILYYNNHSDEIYSCIDDSNKRQVFEAVAHHAEALDLNWTCNDPDPSNFIPIPPDGPNTMRRLYISRTITSPQGVNHYTIRAEAVIDPTIFSQADIVVVDYAWPYYPAI